MSQLFTSGHPSIGDSASASNEHSGLISFKIDWFDLLAVQGTLKSLLQHHNSEASILWHSVKPQGLPGPLKVVDVDLPLCRLGISMNCFELQRM